MTLKAMAGAVCLSVYRVTGCPVSLETVTIVLSLTLDVSESSLWLISGCRYRFGPMSSKLWEYLMKQNIPNTARPMIIKIVKKITIKIMRFSLSVGLSGDSSRTGSESIVVVDEELVVIGVRDLKGQSRRWLSSTGLIVCYNGITDLLFFRRQNSFSLLFNNEWVKGACSYRGIRMCLQMEVKSSMSRPLLWIVFGTALKLEMRV